MIIKVQGYNGSNWKNLLCDNSGKLNAIGRLQGYDYNAEVYRDISVDEVGKLQGLGGNGAIPTNDYRCRAYLDNEQVDLTYNNYVLINLDAETYDPNSNFNVSTHLYTAPIDGIYLILGVIGWNGLSSNDAMIIAIYVNSTNIAQIITQTACTLYLSTPIYDIIALSAGDTVSLYANSGHSGGTADISKGENDTYLSIICLSVT